MHTPVLLSLLVLSPMDENFHDNGLDDALRLSKRDFMEWVESPNKERNASVLLREFEERFARLSAPD